VQDQLNRFNEVPQANKENEQGRLDFETLAVADSNKKLKSKITSSGSKAGIKIRGQASRIVSSFKTQSIVCTLVRDFSGIHNDGKCFIQWNKKFSQIYLFSLGVWEVSSSPIHPLIATASADHTSCIWNINSGKCLLKYEGHTGSVNSIKFHPSKDIMLSSSGDNTAHIWQGAVNYESSSRRGHSSEEELEDDLDDLHDEKERVDTLRTPLQEFSGHSSVVVSADWISGGSETPTQIITASWDRTGFYIKHLLLLM
jgi:WD repeat-containing protein 37